jgi:tetratricopeptide (TPR) repeat protein
VQLELTGLEPRRSDLARGIVIARAARPLDEEAQRALWEALARAGITEPSDPDSPGRDPEGEPGRQWLAAPWLPPLPGEVDAHRAALEAAAAAHGLEAVWFVKIETGIDAVAWKELGGGVEVRARGDEDAEDGPAPAEGEPVDAIFDEAEVLYAAPDAPAGAGARLRANGGAEEGEGGRERAKDEAGGAEAAEDADIAGDEDADDDDDDDDDDELAGRDEESHWRNGLPPLADSVPFPIERYPEVLGAYDSERFGVALKLAGPALPGEESVINAFFALWLSAYQDERADDLEPFQRADVVHDRRHRSALMWVEGFAVPTTVSEQVHFLLWITARIHDVVPVAWARFESVDDAVRARADGGDGLDPFILAGNPFAERFRRHGEEAALLWAVSQSAWSRRELAGMLIEVALEHDPDDPAAAVVAERLLRRALSFDAASDATGYLIIVLVRQHRLADALALARAAQGRDARLLLVGEMAERAPGELGPALELLDAKTVDATDPDELAELVRAVAKHAPAYLTSLLGRLPSDMGLVRALYNVSFSVERPQALAILRKVLSLPTPPADAGEARTALVMAWNNACIHAHALGDYELAVELADGGQRYAPENPYIYHSAACAYAAAGDIPRALEQVQSAIDHDYEHSEKMETDQDLSPLHLDPRFSALFVEWRTRRADLN